jgi:hypothetical protein
MKIRDITFCGSTYDASEGFKRQQLSHFLEEFFFAVKRNRRNIKTMKIAHKCRGMLCVMVFVLEAVKRDEYFDSGQKNQT